MNSSLDPFDPAARLTHFKRAAQHDAAVKLLAVLDSSCAVLDLPILRGDAGVERFRSLPATSLLELRWKAKLSRAPSSGTIAELETLIRGRS